MAVLDKVTAFITRPGAKGTEIMLFRHPFAGNQFPAGTVEENETAEQAALREAAEETGLTDIRVVAWIGVQETVLPPDQRIILQGTKIYARPDPGSFDWAFLRRGLTVNLSRLAGDYAQVSYIEEDRYPDPQYITYQITGWTPQACLAERVRRTFFHLALTGVAPEQWEQASDQHVFTLFWKPLSALPEIVQPQNEWINFVREQCGYDLGGSL